MPSTSAHVAKVRRLFPGTGEGVPELALRNENFRGLCEDFGLAVDALRLLELRNLPQDVEKMREYRQLLRDLERELRSEFDRSTR